MKKLDFFYKLDAKIYMDIWDSVKIVDGLTAEQIITTEIETADIRIPVRDAIKKELKNG